LVIFNYSVWVRVRNREARNCGSRDVAFRALFHIHLSVAHSINMSNIAPKSCTEYQKMVRGQRHPQRITPSDIFSYFAGDAVLVTARLAAKKLCRQLNDTIGDPTNLGPETLKFHRSEIINSLLAECSPSEIEIEPPFWCDYGFNIFIGKNFYANYNCCILGNVLSVFGLIQIARKLLSGIEYPLKVCFSKTGHVRT